MRKLCTIVLLLVGALILPMTGFAQTGKIVGTVTDASTGDPLPGVNVYLDGTTQGTSTDFDGKYVIIGVRPGSYTLVASYISFATQRVEGVQVSLDLTTTINFQLSEEILVGEEVVVVAEAVAVKKDLTSSESRVTSETIDKLPVTELGQVLEVQAGITNRGGLHVRGGRSSEVIYMVDGVPVSDSYDGSSTVQLENDGIEELQVVSGTFNAEYGNAMSGVINIVTKEGRSDRFGGSVSMHSGAYAATGSGGSDYIRGLSADDYTSQGVQYRDVDPYSYLPFNPGHYSNASVTLEGPVWKDRITVFMLGRYFQNDGWFYGANIFNPDGTPGDSSLVAMDNFEKLSWQTNLKVRLSQKLILNLSGQGSGSESRSGDFYRRWSPQGRGRYTDSGMNLRAKLTHLVSNTTFYTFDISSTRRDLTSRLFPEYNDPRYVDFDINPPDSVCSESGCSTVPTGGGRFGRGGTDLGRGTRYSNAFLIKGDLSSQVGEHHLIKTGFQFKRDDLGISGYQLQQAVDENGAALTGENFVPRIPERTSSSFLEFSEIRPQSFSAYVQDKIEYDAIIINAGIRYDYFNANEEVPADKEDPNIFSPLKKINQYNDTNGTGFIEPEEENCRESQDTGTAGGVLVA